MRLKANKTTIVLLGVGVGLSAMVFGGTLWFQQQALNTSLNLLAGREAELSDGRRIAHQRDAAREALELDRQQLVFLENGVSKAAYVPTLLKQLEDLAKSTKNRVVGVRPQVVQEAQNRMEARRDPDAKDGEGDKSKKVEKPEPYTRLSIEVNLIGDYRSAQQFVQRLNRFPKILSVDELQLQPYRQDADELTDRALLEVKAKLTAFVMKEELLPPPVSTVSAVTGTGSVSGGLN